MIYCVDCRVDKKLENNFLKLNLWGKPVFFYVIQELRNVEDCEEIFVLTNSDEIKKLCVEMCEVRFISQIPDERPVFLISGRAVSLKSNTIENAVKIYTTGYLYSVKEQVSVNFVQIQDYVSFLDSPRIVPVNAFLIMDGNDTVKQPFLLNSTEAQVINTKNDFELALVLKRKENNQELLKKAILDRIEAKKKIIQDPSNKDGICLVGHSQMDNWEVSSVGSYTVRNCGIRGISSFEYKEYILDNNMMACAEDIYIVMHGTNDIVYDYSFQDMAESIGSTIQYIKEHKPDSKIFFLQCIHVNGRLDRNNHYIDCLNDYLKLNLRDIKWIDTSALDDDYGNLKTEYTIDGLHLSEEGYRVLQKIVEQEIFNYESNSNNSGQIRI